MTSEIRGDDGFVTSAGGIVLQTRYAIHKEPTSFTTTDRKPMEIDELTVQIMPKSNKSVFKIELSLSHEASATSGSENLMGSATRNGTLIQPLNFGSRVAGISPRSISYHAEQKSTLDGMAFVFVDEPSTSSLITYKAALICSGPSYTMFINRTVKDVDDSAHERGMSTLIVTELSGT